MGIRLNLGRVGDRQGKTQGPRGRAAVRRAGPEGARDGHLGLHRVHHVSQRGFAAEVDGVLIGFVHDPASIIEIRSRAAQCLRNDQANPALKLQADTAVKLTVKAIAKQGPTVTSTPCPIPDTAATAGVEADCPPRRSSSAPPSVSPPCRRSRPAPAPSGSGKSARTGLHGRAGAQSSSWFRSWPRPRWPRSNEAGRCCGSCSRTRSGTSNLGLLLRPVVVRRRLVPGVALAALVLKTFFGGLAAPVIVETALALVPFAVCALALGSYCSLVSRDLLRLRGWRCRSPSSSAAVPCGRGR